MHETLYRRRGQPLGLLISDYTSVNICQQIGYTIQEPGHFSVFHCTIHIPDI